MSYSTTPLVLYITLLFLPSAIPNAIANIALLIYSDNDGLKTLITASDPIWYCISIITATVHFAVCLTVSTQYRATARNLLRIPGIIRSNRIFKAFGSQSGQDVMFKR
uniref:Uncharacterized protein n=1 Tax=Caenorhabditis japonica TaxID=281687 RepID=A0A8R1II42_CAEJA